ncbi:hypothetical protein AB0D67_05145 [Streptosporangium sp. NPDC048047]|uniref:hypothetical protein n=1 Tax=Streptosporangium sp. NPDC048047 TaxID=3155748 RepID=UPI00343F4B6B
MFSLLPSRRIAATVAGAVLLSLSAACGAGADAAMCADALKLMNDYKTDVAGVGVDMEKLNAVNEKFASDMKAMAAKADGDLASGLNDLAASFGSLKVDPNNPGAAAGAMQGLSGKIVSAGTKMNAACS